MNLAHLRYFIAVAELGSVTKAAERLHVTQPAVTRGIRQLEQDLGVSLFDRLPRAMRLTRYGAGYLRHARAVFAQLENARAEMRHLADVPAEDVFIGAGPSWLMGDLPRIVGELSRTYPRVSFRIRGGYDQQMLEMLDRGEVSFILTETFEQQRPDGLVQEPLIHCDYVVACRRDHPLAGQDKVRLQELLDYPWAMPDQAVNALERLRGLFLAQNLPVPDPQIRSTSLSFILTLLGDSDALAFVVRSSLEQKQSERIVALNLDQQLPVRYAGIVKHKDTWESPVVRDLLEILRDSCARNPVQ